MSRNSNCGLKQRISRSDYCISMKHSVVILANVLNSTECPTSKLKNTTEQKEESVPINDMEIYSLKKNYLKVQFETKKIDSLSDFMLVLRKFLDSLENDWKSVKFNQIIAINTNPLRNVYEMTSCKRPIVCSSVPKLKLLKYLQSVWHLVNTVDLDFDFFLQEVKSPGALGTENTHGLIGLDSISQSDDKHVETSDLSEKTERFNNFKWSQHYDVGTLISQGSYSKLFRCINQNLPEKACVIKTVSPNSSEHAQSNIRSEFEILQKAKTEWKVYSSSGTFISPFSTISFPIISSIEFNADSSFGIGYSMELAPYGDLQRWLSDKMPICEKLALRIMKQLIMALQFIHGHLNVVHRDVKCENILLMNTLESDFSIKLGDFGLAVKIENGVKIKEICGTPIYMAPEMLKSIGYTYSVDIWASAIILFCLTIGRQPFVNPTFFDMSLQEKGDPVEDSFRRILDTDVDINPEERMKISGECWNLIMNVFEENPVNRESVNIFLQSEWFRVE